MKPDKQQILDLIAERMEVGQERYGELDVMDGRDFVQETLEEILDACNYIACALLKLKRVQEEQEQLKILHVDGDRCPDCDALQIKTLKPLHYIDCPKLKLAGLEPYEPLRIFRNELQHD